MHARMAFQNTSIIYNIIAKTQYNYWYNVSYYTTSNKPNKLTVATKPYESIK